METKREAILNLARAGKTTKEISVTLNVHRNTVNNVKKLFQATGSVKKRSGGTRRTVRTKNVITKVKNRIRTNPWRSIRKMAKEVGVGKSTMCRIVKEDLHATSRAITTRQLVNKESRSKRAARARDLLNTIKHESGRIIIFSDEKLFHVDRVFNRRNSRYISTKKSEDVDENIKHVFTTKHPAKVMVLGVVASDGQKCPPIFIDQHERITADIYTSLLRKYVLPWIQRTYPDGNYVWQQDGAPCHTAKKTQEFLQRNMAHFWGKEMWPPNSPDLNPLDYSIWAWMEKEVCSKPHSSVPSLKTSIKREWKKMDKDFVKRTCQGFRRRLQAVVDKNGGIFE